MICEFKSNRSVVVAVMIAYCNIYCIVILYYMYIL